MSKRREKNKPQNTLNSQLEQMETKTTKPVVSNTDAVADKLSDFCFHVAELIIGGVILAGLMNQDIDYMMLATLGFLAVILFVLMGIFFAKNSNKSR